MAADGADSTCELLFVYGTLMSRYRNAPATGLRLAADLVGPATYRGKMHRVTGPRGSLVYPVVVPSDDPADIVHGELYRLRERAILRRLDEYEGCAPHSPLPHEYHRVVAPVVDADGLTHHAMLYVYQGSVEGLPTIEGGVFRER